MPKITKRSLEKTVVDLAVAVALESAEAAEVAPSEDGLPSEDSLIIVTEADRRLWKAALRLKGFKRKAKKTS